MSFRVLREVAILSVSIGHTFGGVVLSTKFAARVFLKLVWCFLRRIESWEIFVLAGYG
jgi:hypothetical protein